MKRAMTVRKKVKKHLLLEYFRRETFTKNFGGAKNGIGTERLEKTERTERSHLFHQHQECVD